MTVFAHLQLLWMCFLQFSAQGMYLSLSVEVLDPIFCEKKQNFRNFVLYNCILNLDAEQVKLQITNVKNKEVTANPKPQTLGKVFRKP